MVKKNVGGININFEIVFHPDLDVHIKELVLVYKINDQANMEEYYGNMISPKKWNIVMYDIPLDAKISFFLRYFTTGGLVKTIMKKGKLYNVTAKNNSPDGYNAQIKVTGDEIRNVGRKCLICEKIIPARTNTCETKGCYATYCPTCGRMLPPRSNYCPWDDEIFA